METSGIFTWLELDPIHCQFDRSDKPKMKVTGRSKFIILAFASLDGSSVYHIRLVAAIIYGIPAIGRKRLHSHMEFVGMFEYIYIRSLLRADLGQYGIWLGFRFRHRIR